MVSRNRIGTALLVGALLVAGGALAVGAAGSEAPEPSGPTEEIVVGVSRNVSEEDFLLANQIEEASGNVERELASSVLDRIARALALEGEQLISSTAEMMTDEHRREEALYLLSGGSVLTVWWQEVDPKWDLSRMLEDGEPIDGWPPGTTVALIEQAGHVQVLFTRGELLGSIVVEKPPGVPGARPELSTAEIVTLAERAFAALSDG